MKRLPRTWTDYLAKHPETGMGYQIVSVTLADGRKVEDVAIIECNIIGEVRGHADVPFDPEDIVAIEVTHRRWQFKRSS